MERIKLHLPGSFVFSTVIKVRITDLNYGGHVGNDSFLSLIHEARQQFLNHFGYTELELENVSLIMADAAIEFKRELNYGNEIKISVVANGFDKYGFDIFYKLEKRSSTGELIPVALAKTWMVCYNYDLKKVAAIPQKAIEMITSL